MSRHSKIRYKNCSSEARGESDGVSLTANPTVRGIQQWSKQSFQPHHPGRVGKTPSIIFSRRPVCCVCRSLSGYHFGLTGVLYDYSASYLYYPARTLLGVIRNTGVVLVLVPMSQKIPIKKYWENAIFQCKRGDYFLTS
jgi:hypothetical protein